MQSIPSRQCFPPTMGRGSAWGQTPCTGSESWFLVPKQHRALLQRRLTSLLHYPVRDPSCYGNCLLFILFLLPLIYPLSRHSSFHHRLITLSFPSSLPPPLPPGMNAMSMVGALSNYTASLSSNTTLLRDGQTLSVAVPSGLSVSAGTILGLNKKNQRKERKKRVIDTANGLMFLKKAKKVLVPGPTPGGKKMGRPNPRGGNGSSSDSDDEDGVMELLGESRTRKPCSSSSSVVAMKQKQ
jgi:hypothetical protein